MKGIRRLDDGRIDGEQVEKWKRDGHHPRDRTYHARSRIELDQREAKEKDRES